MTRRSGAWGVMGLVAVVATARGDTFGPATGGGVPDSPAPGVSTTITVNLPEEPLVTCFQEVTINGLLHPWVGHLRATLTHNGVSVDLFSRVGSVAPSDPGDASPLTGNYTFAKDGPSFVDAAMAAASSVPAGSYIRSTANPANPSFFDPDTFTAFEGLPVNGTWTLTLSDHIPDLAGSFTTWTFNATAVASTFSGPGGAILDGFPPGVISVYPVNVPGDPTVGQVVSVKLLGLTHTFVGDLHAKLFHFGMEVDLFSHVGATPAAPSGDSSNLSGNYEFQEAGPSFLAAAQAGGSSFVVPPGAYARSTSDPSFPMFFNPMPLAALMGMPLNGDWVLNISDNAAGNVGAFTGWVLTVLPLGSCTQNFLCIGHGTCLPDENGPFNSLQECEIACECFCPMSGMPCPGGNIGSCPCTCPNGMPCPNEDPLQCCTCLDGSPCLGGDPHNCPQCQPPDCNDNDPCTADDCNPQTGQCSHAPINCDDGDPCTADDCDAELGCTHTPADCDDDDPCTADSCDPGDGSCQHIDIDCDDNNACTDDFCSPGDGQCYHVETIDCDDNNSCTNDFCSPGDGSCQHTDIDCNDNNPCTDDFCSPGDGLCYHVETIACNDDNACTDDFCSPGDGSCQHIENDCNDNDPCTEDFCSPGDGSCQHIVMDCNDDDPCTDDACDAQGNCTHTPNNAPGCGPPPPPQEPVCDGGCPGSCGPTGTGRDKCDPVHLFSGEYYETVTDLRIPGRGFDFVLTRTYRSRIAAATALGHNWDFSYNVSLTQDGSDLTFADGTGRRDTFVAQPDGSWARPEYFRVISPNPDGSITMTKADKALWTFNPLNGSAPAGRIASMTDRNGNWMSFEYDAAGRLWKVRDTLNVPGVDNRVVTFAYNADGRLASVTDWASRQVTYAYYLNGGAGGSAGDLKSVTSPTVTGTPNGNDFPNGKTTTYTYSTGFADERLNHNLLTITDAKGQTYLTNIYATTQDPANVNFDRIVAQLLGEGRYDWVYKTGLDPNSPANHGAVAKTIVNNRNGDVKELFFDAGNRLVIERDYTGRAPNPAEPTDLDLGLNVPVNPLRLDDPPFFETVHEWNSDSQVVRTTFPNGNSVEYTYDSANADPRARGNRITIKHLPGPLGGDQTEIVELFEYDAGFGGCCGFNFVKKHTDARGAETLYDYDGNGNLVHVQHRIPSIVEDFEYNEFGQQAAHVLPANDTGHRRRDEQTYYASGPMTGYLQAEMVDAGGFALTTTYEYDAVGNVVRRIDPRGHDTLQVVNALNEVVRTVSATVGDTVPVRYESDTWFDANGNVVRVDVQNVDDAGIVQANASFSTIHEYDVLNRLVRTCAESGSFNGAIPGQVNLPTCSGLPASEFVTTEFVYDANDNRTLVRSGEAVEGRQPFNVVQTAYDERNLVFRVVRGAGDPGQSTTQSDYDENGNLKRTSEGLEGPPHVTLYAYDGFNRRTSRTDAMGNVVTAHFDANGNRVSVRTDGGLTDVPGSAGNARLSESTAVYDAMDRQTQTARAFFDPATQVPIGDGQSVSQTVYDGVGHAISATNDNSHASLATFDTANRLALTTDALGNTAAYVYDANGNIVSVTEVEKSVLMSDQTFATTYAYDHLDRQTHATDSGGNVTQFGFDSRGNRVVQSDALGNVTRFAFDGLSRLASATRFLSTDGTGSGAPAGTIVTTQTWDDSSRLVAQADDSGNATVYAYDALDRKVAEQMADGTVHSFALDVHDNRVSTTDANASVVASTFDLLDRLVSRSITPGVGVASDTTFETFAYDGLSRLVLAQDNDSQVTRKYDSLSHTISETQQLGANPLRTVSAGFDGVGNRLSLVYPGGRTLTFAYDDLERLGSLDESNDGLPNLLHYDYVGPQRVERVRRSVAGAPASTRIRYFYDSARRVIQTTGRFPPAGSGPIFDDRTYAWNAAFSKTLRYDVRADGPKLQHSYTYDSAQRLDHTVVLAGDSEIMVRDTTYALDGAGNRNQVTGPGSESYVLDDIDPPADWPVNQYTAVGQERREYDTNGNLVRRFAAGDFNADGDVNLADYAAFAACLNNPDAGASAVCRRFDTDLDGDVDLRDTADFATQFGQPASVAAVIKYDYRNQMVEYSDGVSGQRHTYAYDALGRRIRKIVDADAVAGPPKETRFYLNGWREIEEQDAAGATVATYVFGNYIDEILSMRRGDTNYYLHGDDLFNVTVATSATAPTVVERYEYDDYGRPQFLDALSNPLPSGASAIGNPLLFNGRRYDPETGWYYYCTRYLDPTAGRFTTRDTIGTWGDLRNAGNGLTYVNNNPFTLVDPSGEGECCLGKQKTLEAWGEHDWNLPYNNNRNELQHPDSPIELVVQNIEAFRALEPVKKAEANARATAQTECTAFCEKFECPDSDASCRGTVDDGTFFKKDKFGEWPFRREQRDYIEDASKPSRSRRYWVKVKGTFQCTCECKRGWTRRLWDWYIDLY